jgi:hypothetical protein
VVYLLYDIVEKFPNFQVDDFISTYCYQIKPHSTYQLQFLTVHFVHVGIVR